jgi:hypothetical protein
MVYGTHEKWHAPLNTGPVSGTNDSRFRDGKTPSLRSVVECRVTEHKHDEKEPAITDTSTRDC